jgi:hypothetical protein
MPYNIVTLGASTAANVGPSNPIALNWRGGRPVLWRITCSSSVAVGDFTFQWTTDDDSVDHEFVDLSADWVGHDAACDDCGLERHQFDALRNSLNLWLCRGSLHKQHNLP